MSAPVLDIDSYQAMPEEAERAFTVFLANGQRSLTKTAELLNIPRGTVGSWSTRYQWRQRSKDSDQDIARGSVEAAVLIAAAQHEASVKAAISIRDDPKAAPAARMDAIKWLTAIGGLVPSQRIELDTGREEARSESLALSDLQAILARGDVHALIAIAQGRTPSALPAIIDADATPD